MYTSSITLFVKKIGLKGITNDLNNSKVIGACVRAIKPLNSRSRGLEFDSHLAHHVCKAVSKLSIALCPPSSDMYPVLDPMLGSTMLAVFLCLFRAAGYRDG